MTIDSRSLRNVLGCFATGVAVVTTRAAAGQHVAVTINSFSSISLDPPLISFALAKRANILKHFQSANSYAINILAHSQESLSNMFARPSSADWKEIRFQEAENGCALLTDSLAQLECDPYREIDGGDHQVFFGRVVKLHLHSVIDPLLFYRGRYGSYSHSQWEASVVQDGTLTDFSIGGWG
jgi:3-hydroxy-9,10-secoandrosta-1,3,5(10)-triene-9,17-dione monooxygenase reductase component